MIDAWQNPKPVDPRDALSNDEVLLKWKEIKDRLTALKEEELEFRKYVVTREFPKPDEGTNTKELGGGYKLKAVVKFNYKLLENDKVEAGLDKLSKLGNEGAFIVDRLVSWTPNFLLTEYRQLQEDAAKGSKFAIDALAIVHDFLVITEAAPTVDIVEPKVKK